MRKKRIWKRLLSAVLTVTVLSATFSSDLAALAAELPEKDHAQIIQGSEVSDPASDSGNTDTLSDTRGEVTKSEENSAQLSGESQEVPDMAETAGEVAGTEEGQSVDVEQNVYVNGSLQIYNASQLAAVGTGVQVFSGDESAETFGTGAAVTDEDGNPVVYANDANYVLMNDIPLDSGNMWQLPAGFAGSFTSADGGSSTELYDSAADTIYIYHPYQLALMAGDADTAGEPVMSEDYDAAHFGVGQMIYPNGEENGNLTYSREHQYVLSRYFSEEMPEMVADQVDDDKKAGRAYEGQVIFNEQDAEGKIKQYILIGNKQQFEAIGKTDNRGNPIKVTEPVWKRVYEYNSSWDDWIYHIPLDPEQIYPGDADIAAGELLYDDPANNTQDVGEGNFNDSWAWDQTIYRGSKINAAGNGYEFDENAKKNVNMERLAGDDSDPAYTTWANYIIFRDIDLENTERTPLMFSGTMEGRENMVQGAGIRISNIKIKPATTVERGILGIGERTVLDTSKNIGIGFFGTITNQPDASNFGISGGTSSVKNITLSKISVVNSMTEAAEGETLVSGLLGLVGGLLGAVGGLLDTVLGGLGDLMGWITGGDKIFGDVNLEGLLTGLLDIRKTAPDTFATGGFAGRIIGDVEVSGCHVEGLTISNVKDMTGGFVGNVEGLTEYDGLSEELDGTVELLTGLLNIIPGLGLGDLVTFLLGEDGLLSAGELIPTKYIPAKIIDCTVSVQKVENENGKYVGGFAGMQTGSTITGCSVNGLKSVKASKYAGGFSGVTKDAVIKGLLQNLDLELADLNPVSVTENCQVNGQSLIVQSMGKYAGGFTGMAGNSNLSGSSVSGLSSVSAAEKYAGGFAGRATLGSGIIMAGEEEGDIADNGLLGTVTDLLKNVLAGDADSQLLNLVGISAAELDGCSVTGSNFTVSAKEFAGGLIGQGDGTVMPGTALSTISGIGSVHADNYAGGVAGQMLPANGSGVLDGVVAIANVLSFSLNNISVTGSSEGFSVTTTTDYAGGAVGQATGGNIRSVNLTELSQVSADNYAGGFIAYAGPGSVVEAGDESVGLNILGLVKINSLLHVADVIKTEVESCNVGGRNLVVSASGNTSGKSYFSGGFIGENSSSKINNSSVTGLKKVSTELKTVGLIDGENTMTAGYAGGFAARSQVGGLAEVGDSDTIDGLLGGEGLVGIDGLVQAVGYLIPEYTNCYVEFAEFDGTAPQVDGAVSGGFIGEMQGGNVDNSTLGNEYAVRNIKSVHGNNYAGGFAGRIISGGLAQTGGLSVLGTKISLDNLLNLLPVYIPTISHAGVSSELTTAQETNTAGLKVTASEASETDVDAGTAGGYVGLARGARISNSDVNMLATKASAEGITKDDYAVKAPKYAGGYAGKVDIGSAAAVGKELKVLNLVEIGNLTSALAAVESRFESSDVYGKPGGFNVLAVEESAGGYAGSVEGARFNDCDSYNFEYIEGVVSAGGYAGTLQPGSVADLIEDVSILEGALSADNLLSLAKSFIPRVWNSETTAVPCGGYVKASGESKSGIMKGLAGGYVGYNLGGQIIGNETEQSGGVGAKTASAIRIRSVEGQEYAGGFTGLMQAANIADTGSIKILWGLIEKGNLLQAAEAVYPTETNTQVTGPLRGMDVDTWNAWVEHVGAYGAYGKEFDRTFTDQNELNTFLENYMYGYTVEAVAQDNGTGVDDGGSAGGYTGRMEGGVITNAHALDTKSVKAYRSAGGFAGEMITGTVANLGKVSLAGLNIVDNIGLVDTFVPVIYSSSVTGRQAGMTIEATSDRNNTAIGNAGGFAGYITGGQIWQAEGVEGPAASVDNLKSVTSHKYAGGFAGVMESGSALETDVQSENGLLNQILGLIISSKDIDALASVLNATLPTVKTASVDGENIVVDGGHGIYTEAAGGFVGKAKGAIIGDQDGAGNVTVNNLKTVIGGKYAGGFFGVSDVAGVAEVADESSSILGIIGINNINVLSAFRTYIYYANVNGANTGGLTVTAKEEAGKISSANKAYLEGNAGGFGGSLLDSTVLHSNVTNLNSVSAKNYAGGFVGLTGKSGVVDIDNLSILDQVLGASAGVIDVFGSQIEHSAVTGISSGYTVSSRTGTESIAGGFVGYGDLARIDDCQADVLKQVYSDETAGGFIGKTNFAYLAQIDIESPVLLNPILSIVNQLLKFLYIDELEDIGLIQVELPEPFDQILKLQVLNDDNVLSVTLLGIKISVALSKGTGDGGTDVAQIHIGDSYIEIPCHNAEDGNYVDSSNIKVGLIKANRTKVVSSSVTGIPTGYDVFGDGADNENDGKGDKGYAGGFVGYNNEGLLENNNMIQADTIRGASGKIGEFSGASCLESSYDFNTLQGIEGENNYYYVYRMWDTDGLTHVYSKDHSSILSQIEASDTADAVVGGISYYVYPVQHMQYEDMYTHEDVWNGAYQTTSKNIAQFPVNVYVSSAQADLMLGTPTYENSSEPEGSDSVTQDPCAVQGDHTVDKIWIDDGNSGGTRPEEITVTLKPASDGTEPAPETAAGNIDITMDGTMAGSDEDVWTTHQEAPVNYEDADGNLHKYVYNVVETPIVNKSGDQIYATIYDNLDNYTHRITNYLPSELIQEDTVVIDYGLSVDIDVLTNDEALSVGGKLAAVRMKNGEADTWDTSLIGKVTNELEGDFNSDAIWKAELAEGETPVVADGEHGSAQIKTETNEIRFTPDTMSMESVQEIMYAVQLPDNNGQPQYVYGLVTVVPATMIYYEDNYGAITYKEGGYDTEKTEEELEGLTKDKNWKEHGIWQTMSAEGAAGSDVQDTDRPGATEIKEAIDNVYGNDTHYTNCSTYSNGSSKYVRVSAVNTFQNGGTSPVASFTFKGTGFDLISLTSRETGAVAVRVYEGSSKEGKLIVDRIEDTYYGYTYTPGENGEEGVWTPDPDSSEALYQIPIVKETMDGYGEYYVEIIPMYSDAYDMHEDQYYDIYFDAVRIYDPANPENKNYSQIESIYDKDGENHPDYTELRDILLNAENVGGDMPDGAVFVDGNGDLSDVGQYEAYGPKNEVYLAPGQAISFYLWTNQIPDKVQLSAKLALGTSTKLAIATAVQEGKAGSAEGWEFYKEKNWDISTSYDLYYEFTDNCKWIEAEGDNPYMKYRTEYPIVIANPRRNYEEIPTDNAAILSLTNLQWTGRAGNSIGQQPGHEDAEKPEETPEVTPVLLSDESASGQSGITIMASVAPENIPAAYYFVNQAEESTDPGEGEQPGEPENPGDPEDPDKPENPGDIEDPDKPENPGDPEDPENPGDPEQPGGQTPGGEGTDSGSGADSPTSGNTNDQNSQNGENSSAENAVGGSIQTGDYASPSGAIALLALSAAAAILAALQIRRKQRR